MRDLWKTGLASWLPQAAWSNNLSWGEQCWPLHQCLGNHSWGLQIFCCVAAETPISASIH